MDSNFRFSPAPAGSSELILWRSPSLQEDWGRPALSERSRRASFGHELANSPGHLGHRFNVADREDLLQISGEQKIKRPTGHHAQLFRQARQFEEIDRSPHEPCEESGKLYSEDRCDPGVKFSGFLAWLMWRTIY